MTIPLAAQINSVMAALILLTAFGLLIQRRILGLLHLFAWQGFFLCVSTAIVGYVTGEHHLFISSLLTLTFKVILLPYILYALMRKLNIRREIESLVNIPGTMLIGIALVIFSYHLTAPITHLSTLVTRSTLAVALATVMLGLLMMVTRSHAVTQIIGFLAMENGLFFAATSATYGMPMVVELGIALDVLVGVLILGVFMFQIREQFDSLDIRHLERLKED